MSLENRFRSFFVVFGRFLSLENRFRSFLVVENQFFVCPGLSCRGGMKRKNSLAQDREAKRRETVGEAISFSLESYEDYGDDDSQESQPLPPVVQPLAVPVARLKPGTKPSLGFDEFARQQQAATAHLLKMQR